MVQTKDIINYYQNFDYFDGYGNKLERYVLKNLILEFCRDLHISQKLAGTFESHWLYNHLSSLSKRKGWKTVRQAITKYFKENDKVIRIRFKDRPEFIIGHFIESLCAFERSIFWFFNYKHNLDPFNQVASEQALYYSEFFSIVAISRFLGGSINHTSLGMFKVNLIWDKELISIHHPPNLGRGRHRGYSNLFFEQMERIDVTDYEYFKRLKEDKWIQKEGLLMREDRRENVYDLTSRSGDPFKNALFAHLNESTIRASKSWNFLENIDDIYERVGHSDYDGGLAEYLYDEYSGDGYRQDHIGQYWKFLINTLKMVKDTEQYFNKLIWKISRYENCESVDLDKNTKRILFKWINNENKY